MVYHDVFLAGTPNTYMLTYTYIYMCVYTYIHTHTHTYIYIYIYIYTHTHTYTHTYAYTYLCNHIYVCIDLSRWTEERNGGAHIFIYIFIHSYLWMYLFIHIHIHIYKFISMNVFIYRGEQKSEMKESRCQDCGLICTSENSLQNWSIFGLCLCINIVRACVCVCTWV